MIEYFTLGFLYTLAKDGWAAARGRKRRLSPAEVLAKRQKWKSEIEAKLWERRKQKLGMDVIVRDVKRMDDYPNVNEAEKGISAWYKCGLMDTYHRGVMLGLSWEMLKLDENGNWQYANYEASEEDRVKVILIGYVPYENIEAINWNGDEYYGNPHIYCYFDASKREPYERLVFCEKKELNGIPFYTEVCAYASVPKPIKKLGLGD